MEEKLVFKVWSELTEHEQIAASWWDAYKEVYGIRPHDINTSHWTVQDFSDEIDKLYIYLDEGVPNKGDTE